MFFLIETAIGITFKLPEVPKQENAWKTQHFADLDTSGRPKVIPKADLIKKKLCPIYISNKF